MGKLKACLLAAAVAASSMGFSTAASAVTVYGTLTSADDIASFSIIVTTPGTVTFTAFAMPTFDSIFSLYAMPSGSLLAVNDDGYVPGHDTYDSFIGITLGAGKYQLDVTSYANFPNGDLGSGYSGGSGYPLGGDFSVEVTGAAVPEPASWALMIAGFGMVGTSLRRRKVALAAS
ncbi:PEP-CTERM sorting domain-containing protein [Polymorphobacter arshaanensis]|uniref:PEP-CTERM sorting domain-containing protein n=2 Tax=Glacieibacterium arshaanense TaxID=2511025 RepID=A0A4Y9ETD6_9SPHN|nr:PEP-CTERM sorting domain-containing protein [Polymorphobacter arshaanensis]